MRLMAICFKFEKKIIFFIKIPKKIFSKLVIHICSASNISRSNSKALLRISVSLPAESVYMVTEMVAGCFVGTVYIRFLLFPLVILGQRNAAQMHNHLPTMQRLQQRVSVARRAGDLQGCLCIFCSFYVCECMQYDVTESLTCHIGCLGGWITFCQYRNSQDLQKA